MHRLPAGRSAIGKPEGTAGAGGGVPVGSPIGASSSATGTCVISVSALMLGEGVTL